MIWALFVMINKIHEFYKKVKEIFFVWWLILGMEVVKKYKISA